MTKEERRAVDTVLAQFFTLSEGVYLQSRTEKELAELQTKIAASKTNGVKGGRPKNNPNGSRRAG